MKLEKVEVPMGNVWFRNVSAPIVGTAVGAAIFFLGGLVSTRFYPPPPELLNPQTPEANALRVASADTNGLLIVLMGCVVGGFVGGVVAASVATTRKALFSFIVGILLSSWAVYAFYVFYPQRLWFPIGILAGFLVSSILGGLSSARLKK